MPTSPTEKSGRCFYRWMRDECILRDVSHMGCVEVQAAQKSLCRLLHTVVYGHPDAERAAALLDGREHTFLFAANGADAPLGPVQIVCAPRGGDGGDDAVQCWLWSHPAIAADVAAAVTQSEGVACRDLGKDMFRCRLRGPGSTKVLERALRLVHAGNLPATAAPGALCSSAELVEHWQVLAAHVSSPAILTAGSVAGMVVWDPRLKPTKALEKHLAAPAPAAPHSRALMKRLVQVCRLVTGECVGVEVLSEGAVAKCRWRAAQCVSPAPGSF